MHFGKDPETKGIEDIRRGVKEFQGGLEEEQTRLSELFGVLKDEILTSLAKSLDSQRVRLLEKQVRHVISIARAIQYEELEKSFRKEQEVLENIRAILDEYPNANLANRDDIQDSIENLRGMVEKQQELIFEHKEILLHEKQRLVDILTEASELEQHMNTDHHINTLHH